MWEEDLVPYRALRARFPFVMVAHAAYPLMIALFFWERSGRHVRTVLALYPVIMAIALVYTAEHYALDIALGWLDVIVTGFVLQRLWPLHAKPDNTEPASWSRPNQLERTPT